MSQNKNKNKGRQGVIRPQALECWAEDGACVAWGGGAGEEGGCGGVVGGAGEAPSSQAPPSISPQLGHQVLALEPPGHSLS